MSNLQRSFVKAKIAGLPFEPPLPQSTFHEEDEEDKIVLVPEGNPDDDSSSASSASSTGTVIPSPSKHLFARPKGFVRNLICIAVLAKAVLCEPFQSQISAALYNFHFPFFLFKI